MHHTFECILFNNSTAMLLCGIKYHEVLWFPVFLSIKYYYFLVSTVLSISLVYCNILYDEISQFLLNQISTVIYLVDLNARVFFSLKVKLRVLEKVFSLCLHWFSEFQFKIGLLGWHVWRVLWNESCIKSVFLWLHRLIK